MAKSEVVRASRRRFTRRKGYQFIKRIAAFVASQSLVGDEPVYDTAVFPFLVPIEENWHLILSELDDLLRDRAGLPSFHEISRDQAYISAGDSWKVFILFGFGIASQRNCARCPETARLLKTIPGLQSAWFSILAPHYHIPEHRGVTKTLLRTHLGLHIPAQRERCRMRVDNVTVTWQAGRCIVFDDFYRHEVWNETDEERVVLIFDFDRPMRWMGRVINWLLMWAVKRTAYFKDAQRNLRSWDERLEAAAQLGEKLLEKRP